MRGMSHTITTPRWDGATLRAAFTVNPEVAEGSRCLACNEHVGPGKYHECWSPPPEAVKGLHATHTWEPFTYVGDGYKATAYRRSDGAGYVIPIFDEREWKMTDRWWVSWAHPLRGGREGWHHHAFGTYVSANAGAMAFDEVYDLERIAGNVDRMTHEDARAFAASVDRSPEGEKPQALNAKHESAVAATSGETPSTKSGAPDNG